MSAALKTALANSLNWIGRALWRPVLPAWIRANLIAAAMRQSSERGAMRALANGVAAGGGSALAEDPVQALALIARLEGRGGAPILICGDSHSRLYVQRGQRGGRWLLPLHHLATGASARGLANPDSRSREGARLRNLLRGVVRQGGDLPMLLVFGQVDVEFVFMFKRLAVNPPLDHDADAFEGFCVETAQVYAEYAQSLGQPTVAAIFPPALSDAAWREGYLNAHVTNEHAGIRPEVLRERLAAATIESIANRTAQHALFNRRLREAAEARGLGWLDAFAELLGPGGLADSAMIGPEAGRDHHLDARAVQPLLTAKLWSMFESRT